jgi:plasmid replication initiation protein
MSVNKSNELIQKASHDLNSIQLKFWYKVVDLIDSKAENFKHLYDINLEDFILNDLKYENISNLSNIKKEIEDISDKGFHLLDKENNDDIDLYTRWFSTIKTTNNYKRIQVEIPQAMSLYYLDIQGHYTFLNAKIVYKLKSRYSIRLYELISSYKFMKKKKNKDYVEIHYPYLDLKELLGLSNKYKDYRDFKLRVLETAKKELKEKNVDIQFDFKASGRGDGKDIIFKIYNVKEEMERKEANKKKELINNSDNIDKQIYTDIETTLEKMGFNEKERNKLILEHDEMKLRRNINYTLEADKNKKVKTHIKAFLRSALKADYAMNSYEQKQVSKIDKQKEKLKTNNALYQEFIKFIAEIARNKPSGRASVILPNLISDSSSIDTTPFIDKFIDKFFKTIVKIK